VNHPTPLSSSQHRRAVRFGDIVFVGGQMSVDEHGQIVGTDVKTQTRTALEGLQRELATVGATLADIVKHTVYFVCDGDNQAIAKFMEDLDSVRFEYFQAPGPTTTEVRAGLDREGALLMIDAWVVVGAQKELLSPPDHWNWKRQGPFVQGWKVGDMVFVGGQRSLDQAGNVLGLGDIEIQTEEAFRNLDTMLIAAGGDRHTLMRQNTYFRFQGQGRQVTEYWEKMTAVRRRYMSSPSAAGAGLRITGFPHAEELIQVEGIGVLGEEKQRLQPANHWDWSIGGSNFTQGWKIGPLAFIGGQISSDNTGKTIGKDDIEVQTRNVFEFIRRVLAEGGLNESHVAKLYIYYHCNGTWEQIAQTRALINKIQSEFYGSPGPTVTALRVSGFAFEDLLIEIEAVAVTGNSGTAHQ